MFPPHVSTYMSHISSKYQFIESISLTLNNTLLNQILLNLSRCFRNHAEHMFMPHSLRFFGLKHSFYLSTLFSTPVSSTDMIWWTCVSCLIWHKINAICLARLKHIWDLEAQHSAWMCPLPNLARLSARRWPPITFLLLSLYFPQSLIGNSLSFCSCK